MKKSLLLLILLAFLGSTRVLGNGITLSNLTSVAGSGFVQLKFDLTWSNSWYNTTNNDAAWVFFKWKDNDGAWKHLDITNANNSIAAGYSITVSTDLTGVMIHRNTAGYGTVSLTNVMVGVTNLPGSFDVKGFAIEMVQIPMADPYYLGDGEVGTYYENGNTGLPLLVQANTLTLGTTTGNLNDNINNGALASGFPIGYSNLPAPRMFMMKHEVTQGAYRDFLNTLTYDQQNTRTGVAPNSAAGTVAISTAALSRRFGMEIATSGTSNTIPAVYGCDFTGGTGYDQANDGEWIACNYLTWPDVAAFLDWAALRPMTEMEFEKSCRGTVYPVSAENAAGITAAYTSTYPITNPGTASEAATYSGSVLVGNFTYNPTSPGANSPLRVGIHATANATRISAGAGYYGCLDLSGNIVEYTVTSCNVAGRSYTGLNGDGELTTTGDANVDFWPGVNNNTTVGNANTAFSTIGVTGAAGIIERGGSAGHAALNGLKVSYRNNPGGSAARSNVSGGRGVKSW